MIAALGAVLVGLASSRGGTRTPDPEAYGCFRSDSHRRNIRRGVVHEHKTGPKPTQNGRRNRNLTATAQSHVPGAA